MNQVNIVANLCLICNTESWDIARKLLLVASNSLKIILDLSPRPSSPFLSDQGPNVHGMEVRSESCEQLQFTHKGMVGRTKYSICKTITQMYPGPKEVS